MSRLPSLAAHKIWALGKSPFVVHSACPASPSSSTQSTSHLYLFRPPTQRTFTSTPTSSFPALTKLIESMSDSKENPNSFTVSSFLDRNGHFASQCDPQTLAAGVEGQTPILFWLGCSDSRVPESLVIRAGLGEVFVHRNVANLFTPGDTSALAAVAYAINVLKVPHIAVVGHENCGGCAAGLAAATAPAPTEPTACVGMQAIQKWIEPIRQLAVAELQKDEKTDLSRVVTANVVAQVANLADNPVIKDAWGRGQSVCVYGWVYDLATGKINDLNVTRTGN